MIRNRTRGRASTNPWYRSDSYLLNSVAPTLIHDYTNNRYYNSSVGPSSFPFTATRTSNATIFNSAGQLVWAPANMFLNSENVGGTGWGLNASTASSSKIIPNATLTNHGVNGAISVVVGVTYKCSVSAKADGYNYLHFRGMGSSSDGLVFDLSTGVVTTTSGGWVNGTISSEGDGYYRCTGEITALSTTVMQFFISPDGTFATYSGDTISGVILTRSQLHPSPNMSDQYIPNSSTTLAYYGPRFEHNPVTLAIDGLLTEETRANVLTYSRDYSNAIWTKTDTTFTTTLTDISGIANAARLATEGPTATAIIHAGGTVAAGATITVSAILKYTGASPVRWIRLICCDGAITDGFDGWFDIQNGVKGSVAARGVGTSGSSAMVSLGNGWYRCSLKCIPNGTYTTGRITINSASFDGSGARVANATYGIDHAQVEVGTGATSIIPTFGVAATRASDNFQLTVGSWLDQTKGTFFTDYIPSNAVDQTRRLISINDGTSNNSISMCYSTGTATQLRTAVAGVPDFTPSTVTTSPAFTRAKSAMRLLSPDKRVVMNGGAVNSASVAFPTSGITTMNVGAEGAGGARFCGHLREIRYYADATASDAQLQTLTT